jgi:hypothetical protein
MKNKGILINGTVYTVGMFLCFHFMIYRERNMLQNSRSALIAGFLYTVIMLTFVHFRNKKNNKTA